MIIIAYIMSLLFKKSIEYAEKPASDDEQKIARFLEAFVSAFNEKKIDAFSELVPNDISVAVGNIEKVQKALVGKSRYLKIVKESMNSIQSVSYKNIFIRVSGKTASVYGNRVYFFNEFFPTTVPFLFKFEKRGESWQLVYLTLPKN